MAKNQSEIKYEMTGLGEVISNNKLTIPPNQREYSWEEQQVDALLQDITKALDGGGHDYFIGTIVGIPSNDGSRLIIVDGQQRLATTSIFLAEMMRFFKERDGILAKSVKECLFSVDRKKRETLPNLKMGTVDNDFFIHLLSDEVDESRKPTTPSLTRMKKTREISRRRIESITSQYKDDKDKCDQLNQWLDFIERHVKVLLLTVGSNASAYKMFETLNDRGLKTTQGDLIKNFLFGESGDRFEEVEHKWNAMKSILGGISQKDITIDFLRYALTCIIKYARESDVYDFTEVYASSEQSCVNYVTHMESLAQSFAALKMPEHDKWSGKMKGIRWAIRTLIMFNVKPMIPLQLAIVERFTDSECKNAMKFLVSLSVRLAATTGTRSGKQVYALGDAAKKVYNSEINSTNDLKISLHDIIPSDLAFSTSFETFKSSTSELSRYYLRTLESAIQGSGDPWYSLNEDESEMTLEHIYPKKPMGNYPSISDEEAQIYLNRLGNQTLLPQSINSELKSSSFDNKKRRFAEAPYVITKELADYDGDWTGEYINQRQKNMAKYCCKAWPI